MCRVFSLKKSPAKSFFAWFFIVYFCCFPNIASAFEAKVESGVAKKFWTQTFRHLLSEELYQANQYKILSKEYLREDLKNILGEYSGFGNLTVDAYGIASIQELLKEKYARMVRRVALESVDAYDAWNRLDEPYNNILNLPIGKKKTNRVDLIHDHSLAGFRKKLDYMSSEYRNIDSEQEIKKAARGVYYIGLRVGCIKEEIQKLTDDMLTYFDRIDPDSELSETEIKEIGLLEEKRGKLEAVADYYLSSYPLHSSLVMKRPGSNVPLYHDLWNHVSRTFYISQRYSYMPFPHLLWCSNHLGSSQKNRFRIPHPKRTELV